jgi:biopolymer transport protein ExbD
MRLTKSGRRKHTPDMNMTPMIDVVFQLLIFFMVGLQVSKLNSEQLELPQLAGAEEQKERDLTINVTQPGQIVISGKQHTRDAAVRLIADEVVRAEGPANLTVVLRVDRRATCQSVNELVTDLSQMQIKRVRIAVQVPVTV